MKTIEQTINETEIKAVMCLENMYYKIAYDGSPELNEFDPDLMNNVWFVLREDDERAGMIKMGMLNNIMWDCHIFLFEKHRGNGSEEWGKLVATYMRERYGVKKFLAFTPYISAKHYAERVGFKYLTEITQSIQKNGKILDQYVLEMQ